MFTENGGVITVYPTGLRSYGHLWQVIYIMVSVSIPEDFLKICDLSLSSLLIHLACLYAFSDVRTVILAYVVDCMQRKSHYSFHSYKYSHLQSGLVFSPIIMWNSFLHPLKMGFVMWLALANRILAKLHKQWLEKYLLTSACLLSLCWENCCHVNKLDLLFWGETM